MYPSDAKNSVNMRLNCRVSRLGCETRALGVDLFARICHHSPDLSRSVIRIPRGRFVCFRPRLITEIIRKITLVQSKNFEPPAHRWAAFVVLLAANFMNIMDVTIVNVAMPTLKSDFNATANKVEWVVAAYVFVFAVLLLPCGRLGDIIGRRRVFVGGVSLFTLASGLCGLAWSVDSLIAARVLQGVGAAMMSPQAMALIPSLFAPKERGGAFSYFALTAGFASVSGPILGGVLIEADVFGLGWRAIFLVNVPVGILTVILALRLVPKVAGNKAIRIDYLGILLAGSALFCVLLPLVEALGLGWKLWMWPFVVAAPVLAFGFVRWEMHCAASGRSQLLPISLMRKKPFLLGASLVGLLFSGVPGFFLVMALYLQEGFGLSPLWSGLTVMPFSIGVLASSPISNRLGGHFLRHRVLAGGAVLTGAHLMLHFVVLAQVDQVTWSAFAPILFFAGLGVGTTAGPLFQIALMQAEEADTGAASGAIRAMQQLGAAFGIAIMSGLYFATLGHGIPYTQSAYTAALVASLYYTIGAFSVLTICAALARFEVKTDR